MSNLRRIWSSSAVRLLGPVALVGLFVLAGHKGAYLAIGLLCIGLVAVLFSLSRRDVTTVVSIYIVLLILLPSYLTIGDLGAAGSPTTIVGMAALAWWVVSHLVPGQPIATGHQPIRIGIYIFCASILLSFASAFSREIPGVEISGANRGLLEVLGLAGITLLMADGIDTRERLDVLGRRLVYWVGVLSAFGIVQFVTGSTPFQSLYARLPGFTSAYIPQPITSRDGLRRVQATTGSPIEFGLVLACVLPVAVHYAKQAPVGKRGRRWLCVVLIAVELPMSLARTGFVGAAIVFVVMFIGWNVAANQWRARGHALRSGSLRGQARSRRHDHRSFHQCWERPERPSSRAGPRTSRLPRSSVDFLWARLRDLHPLRVHSAGPTGRFPGQSVPRFAHRDWHRRPRMPHSSVAHLAFTALGIRRRPRSRPYVNLPSPSPPPRLASPLDCTFSMPSASTRFRVSCSSSSVRRARFCAQPIGCR